MATDAPAIRGPMGCPRRGRQRDESRDNDIMRAALELLAELGYDRLTIEAVASRAKAGKATVYRRWSSKAELVGAAVAAFAGDLDEEPTDTGSLRGDLIAAFLGALGKVDDAETDVITGLMTAVGRHADLAAVFREQFVATRHCRLRRIFERAAERGEVSAGHDIALLASVGPAMLLHRLLVTGNPLDSRFVARVIDEVILPLATATPGSHLPAAAPLERQPS